MELNSGYKKIYAFLSKGYWETQDEYDDEMRGFYDRVENRDKLFSFEPASTLTIYADEWFSPKTVDDTLDELDEEGDSDVAFICNWKNDEGCELFTLLKKDRANDDIRCVTRTVLFNGLGDVGDSIVDRGWKPLVVRMVGGEKAYVWESPEMNACEFMELYRAWVTLYSDEDGDDVDEEDDDSVGREFLTSGGDVPDGWSTSAVSTAQNTETGLLTSSLKN